MGVLSLFLSIGGQTLPVHLYRYSAILPAFLLGGNTNAIVHAYGAALTAGERHFHDDVERIVAIRQRAQQHGQVDAGDDFDVFDGAQITGAVGRRTAHDVGDHQHAATVVETTHGFHCELLYFRWVLIGDDINGFDALWQTTEYVRCRRDESLTQRGMREKKDTDHEFLLAICTLVRCQTGRRVDCFSCLRLRFPAHRRTWRQHRSRFAA